MRNLGYKILSVAIAVLLYAVASAQRNPRVSRDVYIQPKVENLPQSLSIKNDPSGFNVTVVGSVTAVEAFRGQPVKATMDLSQGQPGVNRVAIRYKNEPQQTDVVGPPFSEVVLEQKRQASFGVDVDYNPNKADPGYQYKDAVITPRQVVVSGLASEVRRVDRVVAFIDNNGPFRGPADVVAQNFRREQIDSVDIEPKTVTVTLEEQRIPANKALILSVAVSGKPAPGFTVVNYVFDPPTVEVTGSPARLKSLGSISVPVDVSGLREATNRTIPLMLPPGVAFASPGESRRVSLQLDVRPIAAPVSPNPTPTPQPSASPSGGDSTPAAPPKEQD
jgi:YbbR domain-containing protein